MKIKSNSIDLKRTLLSGQCFRVKEENDSSFTIILEDRVVNIKEEEGYLIINSNNTDNLKSIVINYLDLDRDYELINEYLLKKDEKLKKVIEYSKHYKILAQPKLEMIISFIISQNNTVKNISNSIEKLCKYYGREITFNNNEYYLFPTLDTLLKLNEEDLKKCGVGFRNKYIINAVKEISNEKDYIRNINELNTEEALKKLMNIKGIGMKVASCILMFGYGRFDAFPIDTWVKKYFNTTNEVEIKKLANEKYKKYCGLVIQYIFHYERNRNVL